MAPAVRANYRRLNPRLRLRTDGQFVGGRGWRLVAAGLGLYRMRLSKFLATRLRKVPARRLHRVMARVNVGSIFRLFKKGQNSRMGKGAGGYLTKRRVVFPGFVWAEARGPGTQRIQALAHYIKARSRGEARLATYEHPDTQRLRRIGFRRERIIRRGRMLRLGVLEYERRRDHHYRRLGFHLQRSWPRWLRRRRRRCRELFRFRQFKRFRRIRLDLRLRHRYRTAVPTMTGAAAYLASRIPLLPPFVPLVEPPKRRKRPLPQRRYRRALRRFMRKGRTLRLG